MILYSPVARYAKDVMFHRTPRQSGTMQYAKRYYSEKHHLHGLKPEVSVLPSGQTIGYSDTHPGSVAEIKILDKILNGIRKRHAKRVVQMSSLMELVTFVSAMWKNGLFCGIMRTSDYSRRFR